MSSPSEVEQVPSHVYPVTFQTHSLRLAFCSAKHRGMLCFLIVDWLTTNSALLETQAWRRFFRVCVLVVLYILCFVVLVTDGCFCLFPFFSPLSVWLSRYGVCVLLPVSIAPPPPPMPQLTPQIPLTGFVARVQENSKFGQAELLKG